MRRMISGAVSRTGFSLAVGEIHASEAVGAVHVARGDQTAEQRMAGAGRDRDIGAIGDFDEAQRVGESEFERYVAADRRDGFDFQLRRAQGQKDRHHVVNAGIGVQDDAARFGGRGGAGVGGRCGGFDVTCAEDSWVPSCAASPVAGFTCGCGKLRRETANGAGDCETRWNWRGICGGSREGAVASGGDIVAFVRARIVSGCRFRFMVIVPPFAPEECGGNSSATWKSIDRIK